MLSGYCEKLLNIIWGNFLVFLFSPIFAREKNRFMCFRQSSYSRISQSFMALQVVRENKSNLFQVDFLGWYKHRENKTYRIISWCILLSHSFPSILVSWDRRGWSLRSVSTEPPHVIKQQLLSLWSMQVSAFIIVYLKTWIMSPSSAYNVDLISPASKSLVLTFV